MDRHLLIGSTLCFLLGFAYTLLARGGRMARSSRFNLAVLAMGFVLQTSFLYLRGEELGRCPLTNFFEVIAFLCWGMVCFYLLIGNAYRLSPLGVFTAPLAFALQTFALIAPLDRSARPALRAAPVNPWLEFHAAFSVLAYGAFALASVAAALYLWQERQLKTRRPRAAFFQLPPIAELGHVNARLVFVGFVLLSLGVGAGIGIGAPGAWLHLSGPIVTWFFYAFLVQARWGAWKIGPRQLARLSIAAFSVALLTLWGLTFVSAQHVAAKQVNPILGFSRKNFIDVNPCASQTKRFSISDFRFPNQPRRNSSVMSCENAESQILRSLSFCSRTVSCPVALKTFRWWLETEYRKSDVQNRLVA